MADARTVREIASMGFTEDQATIALLQSNGDLSAAIELLLAQPQAAAQASPPPRHQPRPIRVAEIEAERALQRALEESRVDAEGGGVVTASPPMTPAPPPPPAMMAPATQAHTAAPAAARTEMTAPQRAALAAAEARLKAQPPTFGGAGMPNAPAFGGASKAVFAPAAMLRPAATMLAPAAVPAAASTGAAAAAPGGSGARPAPRSAAAAAAERSLPLPARSGSVEERVQQCAARLAGKAEAVDVLVASLGRVLQHPDEEKYRRVNPTNPAFARTVGAVAGGVEFLMAVGYEPVHGHLVLQRRDTALLWLGKAALEAVRNSDAYVSSKESLEIARAMGASAVAYDEEEERRRRAFASRVPTEPPEGAAGSSKICVHVGGAANWRRFESCNTLEDLLNYVRSLQGTPPVQTVAQLRVADVTTRPSKAFDVSTQLGLTLQSLGLWPTGHIRCRVNGSDEAYDDAMMQGMPLS